MTNKFERQVKGLLGTKLGMTQVWDEDGKFVPVTVVKADSNVVTHIVELRTADASEYSLGQELTVELFEAGQKVDVVGKTKGKGFAGVMKRHGFKGVGASHGQHKNHRKPGSIGGASYPARVFKGMRMAGRMGAARHTTLNLTIQGVDAENNVLLIKGAIPGPKGGVVLVRTAVKGA